MDDTPFVNDGADTSLRKAVSLLNKIEAKTGSAGGTVALDSASLNALESISVTFPETQNVNVTNAGLNVSVTNLPATQPVSGSVSVSNFPATQPVSGTFWQATQPVSGSVSVSNFPATQAVTLASPPVTPVTDNGGSLTVDGTFWQATQPVSGTVSVSNLPATQPVSGSISVSNFPGTQPVSGTFWPTTQPVSGSVSVSNFPATQPVSIANPPVTPVTDNGGSLTVDGSITATQATAASLKAQAQLLNAAGSVVDYAMTGAAGTPATDVVTVQGIGGGTSIPISGTVNTYPQQGTTSTNTNFSSITSAEIAPAVANRESLTLYNEGPGTLFVNVGGSCSTTSYQVRLFAGDYWEAPAGQLSLQHSGIFGTAGTARAVQVS